MFSSVFISWLIHSIPHPRFFFHFHLISTLLFLLSCSPLFSHLGLTPLSFIYFHLPFSPLFFSPVFISWPKFSIIHFIFHFFPLFFFPGPSGTLLVNERMLESYIIARDRFLKPGGKMFPTLGRCATFATFAYSATFADFCQFWHFATFATFADRVLGFFLTFGLGLGFGSWVLDLQDPPRPLFGRVFVCGGCCQGSLLAAVQLLRSESEPTTPRRNTRLLLAGHTHSIASP